MLLLKSWAESLALFKPKNFKLFFLVSLKTIGRVYKDLFTQFWWVLLGFFVLNVSFTYLKGFFAPSIAQSPLLINIVNIIEISCIDGINYLIVFLFFLLARSSVPLKDFDYIKKYWRHFLYFLLSGVLLMMFFVLAAISLLIIHDTTGASFIRFLDVLYKSFLLSAIPLFVFFLLDSHISLGAFLGSIKRAIKMVWYNYPVFFIFSLFFNNFLYAVLNTVISVILFSIHVPMPEHVGRLFMFIFLVVPICFFGCFYIKRLHEQFTLYFDVKG